MKRTQNVNKCDRIHLNLESVKLKLTAGSSESSVESTFSGVVCESETKIRDSCGKAPSK